MTAFLCVVLAMNTICALKGTIFLMFSRSPDPRVEMIDLLISLGMVVWASILLVGV